MLIHTLSGVNIIGSRLNNIDQHSGVWSISIKLWLTFINPRCLQCFSSYLYFSKKVTVFTLLERYSQVLEGISSFMTLFIEWKLDHFGGDAAIFVSWLCIFHYNPPAIVLSLPSGSIRENTSMFLSMLDWYPAVGIWLWSQKNCPLSWNML